ncbi:hypothetical protein [Levilactobacillus brevis]|uniref:hypothetical protein n=1 Tax=Levilactobacillus brevis TaxID=1580 RepID=UPI0021A693DC|nr:hypothetical protein [Levilactobacillus brevis]
MQFDTTYLTEAGRSLATGTLGGLDKIQFTRAVASSHDYSATPVNDLKKLTSIEDVQQTVEYSRIIKKDDTTLTMRVDFPSKDVTTAYSLYTVGFYARPENGDEILYGVLPSSLPDYIAAYDGKSNLNDSFQTDTTVSDADNVLITVSQAGSLNEADLDAIFASKHIATIDDIKANIPATVIDGSKPADFKESVTLEKGAVDGEGNAIATAKNVSDGDAATLKSAEEYADAKVSGKADDSKVVHKTGDEEISGSKTFDTAPVDKTTGNPYITVTDLNNGLNTKVTDNKDGTEQLNGVQVQPYNKLSDVTSLRNIALQTDNVIPYTAKGGAGEVMKAFPLYSGFSSLPSGTQIYYSYDLVVTNADGGTQWLNWTSPWSNFAGRKSITTDGIHHFQGTAIIPDKDIVSGQTISSTVDNSHATYQITNLMIVVGSIPVTHLPAPEDKADDSKVVHKTGDEEISGSKTFDTAPIDKATGNPYITKSDVTTAINAATANVVDRNPDTGVVSKPTDFTNLTVNGGKSVATRDDLKSIEDASWHTITGKSDSLSAYTCMYRKNNEQKYVDLVLYGTMGITVDTSDSYTELLDLSEIISAPNKAKGGIVCPLSAATGGGVSGSVSISGTKLLFSWNINNTLLYTGRPIISVGNDLNSPFLRVTFD